MILDFCLFGNIRHNFLVPRMNESAPKTLMRIQSVRNEWENKLTVLYKACTIYNLNISSLLTKRTMIDFFFSKYVQYLFVI